MGRKSLAGLAVDIVGYVTGRGEIPLTEPPGELPYPIDWRFTLERPDRYFAPFDQAGLPMKRFDKTVDPEYLPSRLATWALAHWTELEDSPDPRHEHCFLRTAEWFAEQPDGRCYHRFDIAGCGTSGPWLSALSQGQAVSVLTRAHALTGDPSFLSAALAAAEPLITWQADGGVMRTLAGVGPFLEEYPGRSATLNGCLLAVVGLDDLIASGQADQLISHRSDLVETVADQVKGWERAGWSLYNHAPVDSAIRPNFNTVRYHRLHVRLLDHFARNTGDQRLIAAADRTRAAMGRIGLRLAALTRKTHYRLRARW